MGEPIVFTPTEIMTIIIAVCAGIVTISGAIGAVANWIAKARQPEYKQNERIYKCEERLDELEKNLENHMKYIGNDDNRIKSIEESNRITQRSMLALLKHSINGADIETLKKAEKDLEEYLINKEL